MTTVEKRRVLELVRAHPVPARVERGPFQVALAAMAAVALVAVFLLAGGFAGAAGGRPVPITAWLLLGAVAMAIGATWLALPRRRSMLPRARSVRLAVAIGVPLLAGAWLALWGTAYQDPFFRAGYRCFALTAATAPWPFAALVFASRRIDPGEPALTGAALGAAAGAWAAVMVELWCPLADPAHVAKGHVLPLLAVVLAGALLGRRLFRMRIAR